MSSTVRGFNIRDLTQHARAELGQVACNPAKVLPATATGNLFTVTGIILVTGLFGVVTTALSVTSVNLKIGITGNTSAIAANPSVALVSTGVGNVIIPPAALGGALPAPSNAQNVAAGAGVFVLNNTILTLTTDATNTGAVTWVMSWMPLYPKKAATQVTAN